ncbi:hypothetical protein Dimus_035661, partial [Dionaea muscipula]
MEGSLVACSFPSCSSNYPFSKHRSTSKVNPSPPNVPTTIASLVPVYEENIIPLPSDNTIVE